MSFPTKPAMPREYWQGLADGSNLGMKLTAGDVEAWFDSVWVRYATYKKRPYTNHVKAIASWFSRASRLDVEKAIQMSQEISDTIAAMALLDAADALPPVTPATHRRTFRGRKASGL